MTVAPAFRAPDAIERLEIALDAGDVHAATLELRDAIEEALMVREGHEIDKLIARERASNIAQGLSVILARVAR
jgi:hypothetical protein